MSVDIADSGGKLEDQINLQHLEELMTIFNVSVEIDSRTDCDFSTEQNARENEGD